jgi:hypothetical protein
MLTTITLLVAMLTNLLVLPSLVLSLNKRIMTKAFSEPLLEIMDEEEDIELGCAGGSWTHASPSNAPNDRIDA